jgi:hypothetical protein
MKSEICEMVILFSPGPWLPMYSSTMKKLLGLEALERKIRDKEASETVLKQRNAELEKELGKMQSFAVGLSDLWTVGGDM